MDECCGSKTDKPIKFECTCGEECKCCQIGFDEEPTSTPFCCNEPMKKVE
jgi:hypothetical protein